MAFPLLVQAMAWINSTTMIVSTKPSATVCPIESSGFFMFPSYSRDGRSRDIHHTIGLRLSNPLSVALEASLADRQLIPFSPTAALIRRHDRERYLTTLFAPAESRDSLFALYAFNYELARAREMVSEPLLGRMRLQWWRDTIEEIYSDAPTRRHDVALALANAIRKHQLSRSHLDALIDSRETDMTDESPVDLAALEAYADASSGRLVLAALEILGVRDSVAIAAGREIGIAHALAGLMRAVPFHARARRIFLPSDLVDAVARRALLDLRPPAALPLVVEAIAERARLRLERARQRRGEVPREAVPALLAGVLAQRSLDRLAKAKYDVFARRLARPDAMLVTRLGLAALRNRY